MQAVEPPGGLHRLLTGWLGSLHQADVVVEGHRPRPGETGHGVDVAGPGGGYAEGRHRDLTRGDLGKGARRPGDRHRWHGAPGPVDPRRAWTGLEARHGGVVVAAALAEPALDVDAHHVARVRWILHHAHTGDPGAVVRAAAGGRAAVIGDRHAVGQVLRAGLGPPRAGCVVRAGGDRERDGEGGGVERAHARGAVRGAGSRAGRVTAAQAELELRLRRDREVVRHAGPAVVEVGAVVERGEDRLVGSAGRVRRAGRVGDGSGGATHVRRRGAGYRALLALLADEDELVDVGTPRR